MFIEFENNTPIDNSFPNNKKDDGSRWYTRNQDILLFKDMSKYPDKASLNLVFSSSENDQKSISCFTEGLYFLKDSAFFLDMSNRGNLSCDFTQIEPITLSSIESRMKELMHLKKLIS